MAKVLHRVLVKLPVRVVPPHHHQPHQSHQTHTSMPRLLPQPHHHRLRSRAYPRLVHKVFRRMCAKNCEGTRGDTFVAKGLYIGGCMLVMSRIVHFNGQSNEEDTYPSCAYRSALQLHATSLFVVNLSTVVAELLDGLPSDSCIALVALNLNASQGRTTKSSSK